MSRKYPKYKGKLLSCEPDPKADAKQRSIRELLKTIAEDRLLGPMSPEERKKYLEDSKRLKEMSAREFEYTRQKLLLAQKAFEKRQEDKLALIGPLNHRLAARKTQSAAAAAAHVVSDERVVKAKIERKLEADITLYIRNKYGEKAETILGNFFDTVDFNQAYNSGRLTPSDNYSKIAIHWINEIEGRIASGELLGNGGGGGAAAMFETNGDEEEEGPLRRLDGGKKSRKSKKSKKSKKSRKARHSKRSKTRKHL